MDLPTLYNETPSGYFLYYNFSNGTDLMLQSFITYNFLIKLCRICLYCLHLDCWYVIQLPLRYTEDSDKNYVSAAR